MKKQLLILIITILSLNCYSQINFEKGYYIDNTDKRVNCLIKNIDWHNNPTEFKHKLSENTEPATKTISSVKEFGINNTLKYVRKVVKIDRSSNNFNSLSYHKNPIFKEEKLFLKVLVEGEATLYQYTDENLTRYFYKKGESIEQLIFKSYRINTNKVGENNTFRQQLWSDLKNPTFGINKIKKLDYKKSDLVDFFRAYNGEEEEKYVNYEKKEKRDLFNLTIRPRINNSSLTTQSSFKNYGNIDFGNKIGFSLGVEAEFILPFNKNKWSFAVEPTYQSFKAEKLIENLNTVSGNVLLVNTDYKSIEIPITIRHYFFLNNNSKIFLNASYILDLELNPSMEFTRDNGSLFSSLEVRGTPNVGFGLGYKHNNKYSVELRYQLPRDILANYQVWKSDYKTLSVIFGYSLF